MSFVEVISADETLVREALSGGTWLADAIELIERDMRALWNVEANVRILKAIDESRDWYLGKAGAALPNPMLSTLIRPAGDEDQKLAHRLLAYGFIGDTPLGPLMSFLSFVSLCGSLHWGHSPHF